MDPLEVGFDLPANSGGRVSLTGGTEDEDISGHDAAIL